MKTSFQVMPITQAASGLLQSTNTIIWLSRHPMTPEQVASLPDTQILHYNPTFGLNEQEAIRAMVKLADENNAGRIMGVFPGSLLVEMVGYSRRCPPFGVAVAAPQYAEDGSPRGFIHKGWKMF